MIGLASRASRVVFVAVVMAGSAGALSAQVPGDRGGPDPSGGPGRVTVLSGAALRSVGLQTLADALRECAGLDAVSTGAADGGHVALSADGGGPNQVLVRWNGIPLAMGAVTPDLESLTLDGVERIEIRRGAAADLAGLGSATAVVDVWTIPGASRDGGALEVGGGQDATAAGRGEAATGGRGWMLSVAASGLRTDGGLASQEEFRRGAAGASVVAGDERATWLRAGAYVARGSYGYSGPDMGLAPYVSSPFSLAPYDQDRRATRYIVSLEAGTVLHGLALSALAGRYGDDVRNVGVPADTITFPFLVGYRTVDHESAHRNHYQVAAGYRVAPWLALSGGVEVDEALDVLADSSSQGAAGNWSEWDQPYRSTAIRAGLVGGREGGPWSYSAGIRRDRPKYGPAATTWRGEVARRLGAGTWVRVAARTGFRDRSDSGGPLAYPVLAAEQDRTLEAGVSHAFGGGRARLAATYIEQRFDDFISLVPVGFTVTGASYASLNVGLARARGWEIEAELRPVRGLSVTATWTHLPTKAVARTAPLGGLDFVAGQPVPGRVADVVVGTARLRLRRGASLDLRVRGIGRRGVPYEVTGLPGDSTRLAGYATVDLGGRIPVAPGLQLTIRAANLLDARYQERYGYPAHGRWLGVGVRLGAP